MNPKEGIFERINEALSQGRAEGYVTSPDDSSPVLINEELVRQVSPTDDLCNLFIQRIEQLGDSAVTFESVEDASSWLKEDLQKRNLKDGCIDPDVEQYLSFDGSMVPESQNEVVEAEFGITLAEFAIAEMGTIALASSSMSRRMNSLAPPMHYCLVRRSTILADVLDAFEKHKMMKTPAGIVWITGSSRTADIDGILIHGAHGPKSLTILIVND